MQSRLMSTLRNEAASSKDRVAWARAVCRQASQLARQGFSSEAVAAINAVRSEFGNRFGAEVASWLLLAEGILQFFENDWMAAHDRTRRAYVMASALKAESALPSCAAWLATIEFNLCRFDEAISHLSEAVLSATKEDHQARARAGLTTGDLYHYAGDFSKARPWYDSARNHASIEGDEATLSALMFNMASTRSVEIRLASAFGEQTLPELRQASSEVNSAVTYDTVIGTQSYAEVAPLVKAQLAVADRRFESGLSIFEQINTPELDNRIRAAVDVDIAWCCANCGDVDRARIVFTKLYARSLDDQESDDEAYILGRLSQIAELIGDVPKAIEIRDRANAALKRHREAQQHILEAIALKPALARPD